MGSHDPFGHFKHKLWPKERVKLVDWLLITKTWKSPWFPGMQHTIGKFLTRATTLLQTSLQSEIFMRSYGPSKLWESQLWELSGSPRTKCHLDVAFVERCREYYMGDGGGFPWVRAVVSLVSPKSHVARPSTKGATKSELIKLWLVGCRSE
jgi:hypothetical protein